MISVIFTGGKQYIVKSGDKLKIEKIVANEGENFDFDKVLLKADEDGTMVELGKPFIDGAKVSCNILKQGRGKKLLVQKFKRKTRYHKSYGHRQHFTQVEFK